MTRLLLPKPTKIRFHLVAWHLVCVIIEACYWIVIRNWLSIVFESRLYRWFCSLHNILDFRLTFSLHHPRLLRHFFHFGCWWQNRLHTVAYSWCFCSWILFILLFLLWCGWLWTLWRLVAILYEVYHFRLVNLIFLDYPIEELLSMRSNLRTWSSLYELLNRLPIFTVLLYCLNESQMLLPVPATLHCVRVRV